MQSTLQMTVHFLDENNKSDQETMEVENAPHAAETLLTRGLQFVVSEPPLRKEVIIPPHRITKIEY